jgi:hypothetical protein
VRDFTDGAADEGRDLVAECSKLHFEVHPLQPEQSANQAAKWHSSKLQSGPIIAEAFPVRKMSGLRED